MSDYIVKVDFDDLETNEYNMFFDVIYKGEKFTGIAFMNSPYNYEEYSYKDGYGHGKCFAVSKNGQKVNEFELFEGKYINEQYKWYPNGQLKEYIRHTPKPFTVRRTWNESGILILEDYEEKEVKKEYYSTGELMRDYKKPIECICYSKEGDWIYKHKYADGYDDCLFVEGKYFDFNVPYIVKNYNEILKEDSLHNYIFLWLRELVVYDRVLTVDIISNLINGENIFVKYKAVNFAGDYKLKETGGCLLEIALSDKSTPPSSCYCSSISERAKVALERLK